MARFMGAGSGCPGRAGHRFSREATEVIEAARGEVARYLGAADPGEIVFTRNATEALNLVAACMGFRPGDGVVTTGLEHNSNLLPWQRLAAARDVRHTILPVDPARGLDLGELERALDQDVKLVSLFHVSNLCGIELPVSEIAEIVHAAGARLLVDGAQGALTHPLALSDTGVDLYACSFHKLFGPTGVGALRVAPDLMARWPAFHVGGDTVEDVRYREATYASGPRRFEAGVGNAIGAVGAAAAVRYASRLGPARIHAHVIELNRQASAALATFDRVHLIGPPEPERRNAILNFHVAGLDSRALAGLLDQRAGVMTRYGKHCVHAWYHASGTPDSLRVSFSAYNTPEEVTRFTDTLAAILSMIG